MAPKHLAGSCFFALSAVLAAQTTVNTAQFDSRRTAASTAESVLNPANVNVSGFGKLFSRTVDASQYAQPLIAGNLFIPGVGQRNVLYVATMANTVYAFDADTPSVAAPLWSRNLGTPSAGTPFLGPLSWGILSTPFIDRATNTIYVVAKVKNGLDTGLFVHALDLTTGVPKYNSGARMSFPFSGGSLTNVPDAIQRAGLLVSRGVLYVAVAAVILDPSNVFSQEGYLQSFDAANLSTRLGSFQVTPTGLKGGIWQAGRGVAADDNGDVYVVTAGGDYDGLNNFGSSILKLARSTLGLLDWFTPANHAVLKTGNIDPSGNGAMLIPGTNFAIMGGKSGRIYLLNRSNMGRLEAGAAPVQQFQATQGCGLTDCSQTPGTAYWNNTLYIWDRDDFLRAYSFNGSTFNTTAVSVSTVKPLMNGGPSVSSNGADAGSGVVWAITTAANAFETVVPGTLRAFRATNVADELYNSGQNSARDAAGNFTKMAAPIVANGKVYVPTQDNQVHVYGLLCAEDRTARFTVQQGPLQQTGPGTFARKLTVVNNGPAVVNARIAVAGLPSGTSLTNARGATACAAPARTPFTPLDSLNVAAGGSTSVRLSFTAPSAAAVTYSIRILGNSPNF